MRSCLLTAMFQCVFIAMVAAMLSAAGIAACSALVFFNVRGNMLSALGALQRCTALRHLDVGSNRLTAFPTDCLPAASLQHLSLHANRCICRVSSPSCCYSSCKRCATYNPNLHWIIFTSFVTGKKARCISAALLLRRDYYCNFCAQYPLCNFKQKHVLR
jgi:hypothetical protein